MKAVSCFFLFVTVMKVHLKGNVAAEYSEPGQ